MSVAEIDEAMEVSPEDIEIGYLLVYAARFPDKVRRLGAQLRFVFREFPLTMIHPEAEHAAEAAEAAAVQRAFWQMHDRLFERQFALDDDHLVEYADELGLDSERIRGELAAGTYTPNVREDFMSGIKSGVNGTPTFYINGIRHDGGYDLESLLTALGSAAAVAAT